MHTSSLPRSAVASGLALTSSLALVVGLSVPAGATGSVRAFSASISQACSVAGTSSSLSIVVSGKAPKSVLPGASFSVTGMTFDVGFSSSETALAAAFGVKTASASVSQLDFSASGAAPATLDAVKPGTVLSSGAVPVVGGQPATVRIPQQGTFSLKGFKAPRSGTMTLTAGIISAALTAVPWLDGSPLSCQPSATPLTEIPVR